jgi:glycosyltransferase involved in cell wall biosynthesis
MRILFLRQSEHKSITPEKVLEKGYGATETCFVYLARALSKNHEVKVCCPCQEQRTYDDVEYIHFKDYGQVYELTKKFLPHFLIVVANPSILLKLKFNTKVIFWQHNHPLELKFPVNTLLDRGLCVVMPSPEAAFVANRAYKDTRILGIYNGVRTEIFNDRLEYRDSETILYSGSFVRAKGLLELLRAAKELKQLKFRLCGGFDLYGTVDELYKKECLELATENVEFLGNLKADELSQELNKASLCICNPIVGNKEVCCVSMLESMACRTPVLIGHNEIVEKIVAQGGFVALKKLSYEIQKVMSNRDELLNKSVQGRDWVHQNLSWEKIAEEWNSLFERL